MFLHRKELIQPVSVGKPDARFGTFLLEQFGGATGELTAALQYWVQSFHVEDAGIRDMLQDIAIEEFGHLEMVGKLIAQHTSKIDQTPVYDAPLFKLKGGGPHFLDSQGSSWTAAYINEGGNVVRDLRANIASEAGARQTYEALIKACEDAPTKKVLTHLLTREITHANMFMKALESRWASSTIRCSATSRPTTPSSWCSTCRRARMRAAPGMRRRTLSTSPGRSLRAVSPLPRSTRMTKSNAVARPKRTAKPRTKKH